MKRRLVAVTLSLIMTMATVSEAGAAAFTSPDTAPAVATQTDAEEVNVTEETSETEADAFSDGDDGTAVPSQEQTDDAYVERRKCLIDGLNRIPGVYSPIPIGQMAPVYPYLMHNEDGSVATDGTNL
mgnify:CR=1 FL=1